MSEKAETNHSLQKMSEVKQKTHSLTEQGVWLLAARVIGFAFSLILPLLLVRRLSQHEFGLYKQAFLLIVTAASMLPLGFGMSAFYFLPRETPEKRRQIIFNILLFNLIVGGAACLALFAAPQMLGALFQNPEMTKLAPLIGGVIFFWLFSSFLETVAVANQEPRVSTAFIISSQVTKTALLFSAAVIFGTIESLIYAALIQTVLQTAILFGYLKSRFPHFWTAFDWQTLKTQAIYALPFGFAGLLWTMQTDLHNYFVSHRFSAEEFAVYAIGCFELPLIGMLSEAVSSVMIPRMSELESRNDRREMINLSVRAMERLALAYFPIFIFLMITAEPFISTLFTATYLSSVPVFRINLLLLPFYIITLDAIVRSYKDLGRFLLVFRIFVFFAMVAALWFGINNFDLQGMIAIVVAVSLIEKTVLSIRVGQKLGVKLADLPMLGRVCKIAAASAFAGILTFVVYFLCKDMPAFVTLILCGAVFAPIYLASILLLGAVTTDEKEMFSNLIQKLLKRFHKNNGEKTISAEI